jgi:hypothetical protein
MKQSFAKRRDGLLQSCRTVRNSDSCRIFAIRKGSIVRMVGAPDARNWNRVAGARFSTDAEAD